MGEVHRDLLKAYLQSIEDKTPITSSLLDLAIYAELNRLQLIMRTTQPLGWELTQLGKKVLRET